MAYLETDLTPTDTTSVAWGIAWTRFLLKDTNDTELFTDAEVEAILEATAWTYTPSGGTATTYYRPHLAAGHLVEADPDRATSETTLGASWQGRPPGVIARAIRKNGSWIDDAIEDAADRRPPSHLTLTPRF